MVKLVLPSLSELSFTGEFFGLNLLSFSQRLNLISLFLMGYCV